MLKLNEELDQTLAKGQMTVTRDELEELDYSYSGLRKALRRLKDNNRLIEPREGFFVIVPPRYRNRGVPPEQFIDELMDYEKRNYYVGLLSAAQSYGAKHQSPMVFQVIVQKDHADIELERTTIQFIKNSVDFRPGMIEKEKTSAGYYDRSTPNVTVVDAVYYRKQAGGLSNVANLIAELNEQLDAEEMKAYSLRAHGRSTLQRLGYILRELGLKELARPIRSFIEKQSFSWTPLNPSGRRSGHERDDSFKLIVNYPLEPDVKPRRGDDVA